MKFTYRGFAVAMAAVLVASLPMTALAQGRDQRSGEIASGAGDEHAVRLHAARLTQSSLHQEPRVSRNRGRLGSSGSHETASAVQM